MGISDSQCSAIGAPAPKTWDDYERGCLSTYSGGHNTPETREAFRHGMSTVFNLLRNEFPEAAVCKENVPVTDAEISDELAWLRGAWIADYPEVWKAGEQNGFDKAIGQTADFIERIGSEKQKLVESLRTMLICAAGVRVSNTIERDVLQEGVNQAVAVLKQ